jgi:hypothetical protein
VLTLGLVAAPAALAALSGWSAGQQVADLFERLVEPEALAGPAVRAGLRRRRGPPRCARWSLPNRDPLDGGGPDATAITVCRYRRLSALSNGAQRDHDGRSGSLCSEWVGPVTTDGEESRVAVVPRHTVVDHREPRRGKAATTRRPTGQPTFRWTLSLADGPGVASPIHGPSIEGSITPSSNQV